MVKIAWFITNDKYVDRRIFFFVEILKNRGYKVKLFSSAYSSISIADDYDYIKRPMTDRIVREYHSSINELSEDDRRCIDEVRRYLAEGRKIYPKRLMEKVGIQGIYVNNKTSIIRIKRESYSIVFSKSTDACTIIYSEKNNKFIKACESSIYNQILSKDGSKVMIPFKENVENNSLYFGIGDQDVLRFDVGKNELHYLEPYPINGINEKDIMKTILYDYCSFKQNIFNYTPILKRVNEELMIETPDVVYNADLPTLPIGIMLKETTGCKLIMDCHEWWYKQTEMWDPDKRRIHLSEKFEKELYPQCNLVITVGQYLASKMQEQYQCRFEVIYSSIGRELSISDHRDEDFLKKKYHIPLNSKIAIFQGGMTANRNLINLAKATKYLADDCYLLLLTTGEYQKVFKKALNKDGNPNKVIWGGWIEQKMLLKYTQNADLGIIPYTAVNDYSECFVPNKLMEYYEAGIPIFYDYSLKELDLVIAGEQIGFSANMKNVEEFGVRLNEILHDTEALQKCRDRYLQSEEKFSYEGQRRRFEEILEEYQIL